MLYRVKRRNSSKQSTRSQEIDLRCNYIINTRPQSPQSPKLQSSNLLNPFTSSPSPQILIKMSLPTGLQPYISPVPDVLHWELALSLFFVGFILFSWLFIYQVTTTKQYRSLTREVLIATAISILWGLASLFGMLTAGVYV